MAFVHGVSTKFYYNNIDMTPYIEDVTADFEREIADVKPMDSTWVERLAGLRTVTVSLGGVYDATASTIEPQIWDAFGDGENHVFALCPTGDSIGNYCYAGTSKANSASINSSSTDAVKYPVGAIGSTNADRALILHNLTEETDDGSSASQDNGSATALGGTGYLLTTAIEGGETNDVIIEHSANDSDWSTLITFTQVSAAGDEVIELGSTADVYRYVRATWNLSEGEGSDSTFFVAFRRNT